jgi:hypothetical protein
MKLKVIQEERFGIWIDPDGIIQVPNFPKPQFRIEQSELGVHLFPIPKCVQ